MAHKLKLEKNSGMGWEMNFWNASNVKNLFDLLNLYIKIKVRFSKSFSKIIVDDRRKYKIMLQNLLLCA